MSAWGVNFKISASGSMWPMSTERCSTQSLSLWCCGFVTSSGRQVSSPQFHFLFFKNVFNSDASLKSAANVDAEICVLNCRTVCIFPDWNEFVFTISESKTVATSQRACSAVKIFWSCNSEVCDSKFCKKLKSKIAAEPRFECSWFVNLNILWDSCKSVSKKRLQKSMSSCAYVFPSFVFNGNSTSMLSNVVITGAMFFR